jgi:hypothetical protein
VEAASTSEMSVNFFQTTRLNNPENCHLQGNVFEMDTKSVEARALRITVIFTPR